MKQQILGLLCTILFVLLSAIQAVYAGNKIQSLHPMAFCFFIFLFIVIICFIALLIKGEFKLNIIKKDFRIFLILNFATTGSWMGFFVAVKYIEPAIAVIIIGAIGPALVSLFSSRIRPESKICQINKEIIMFLTKLISFLIKLRNLFLASSKKNNFDKYFIKITEIYTDQPIEKLMLKYVFWGLSAKISYSEFIRSPLIYAVDPDQIILLAKETRKRIVKVNTKEEILTFHPQPSRMK